MKNVGASVIYGIHASISLQDGKLLYVFTNILCALSMIMSNNWAPALWVLMHEVLHGPFVPHSLMLS
jgi:hypothetical protein